MGGECGMCGQKIHSGFSWEGLKERDRLEDLGVDGVILKRRGREIVWSVHWAQDGAVWRSVLKHKMRSTFD
jgi:hypothetical protein